MHAGVGVSLCVGRPCPQVYCLTIPPQDRSGWDALTSTTLQLLEQLRSAVAAGQARQQQRQAAGSNGNGNGAASGGAGGAGGGLHLTVFGESFGGVLALRVAHAARAGLVDKVVLLNPGAWLNALAAGKKEDARTRKGIMQSSPTAVRCPNHLLATPCAWAPLASPSPPGFAFCAPPIGVLSRLLCWRLSGRFASVSSAHLLSSCCLGVRSLAATCFNQSLSGLSAAVSSTNLVSLFPQVSPRVHLLGFGDARHWQRRMRMPRPAVAHALRRLAPGSPAADGKARRDDSGVVWCARCLPARSRCTGRPRRCCCPCCWTAAVWAPRACAACKR